MDKRRFHPGDMARIIYSRDKTLIGQIVVIEEWLPAHSRWAVLLTGAPIAGMALGRGEFVVTRRAAGRDSSLEPIGGEEALFGSNEHAREVSYD